MFAFASQCPRTGLGFGCGSSVGVLLHVVALLLLEVGLVVDLSIAAAADVVLDAETLFFGEDDMFDTMTERVASNSALGPGKFILLLKLSEHRRPWRADAMLLRERRRIGMDDEGARCGVGEETFVRSSSRSSLLQGRVKYGPVNDLGLWLMAAG